jgi:pimeloyl-ACP methyl ester carboxylesterase
VYGDIEAYAPLIEARLAGIARAGGGERVALVCHSMGGLAARAYLRRYGGARVERVITLGTPHGGTVLAKAGAGTNARQMEPGNPWLVALARDEGGTWPCPVASIWSYDDNVVAPRPLAHLEGARNLPLAGIGHISLPMCTRVARLVEAELDAPPTRQAPADAS